MWDPYYDSGITAYAASWLPILTEVRGNKCYHKSLNKETFPVLISGFRTGNTPIYPRVPMEWKVTWGHFTGSNGMWPLSKWSWFAKCLEVPLLLVMFGCSSRLHWWSFDMTGDPESLVFCEIKPARSFVGPAAQYPLAVILLVAATRD